MPVPSTVNDLDPVASNNSPAGSEPIGPDLDAYLRSHAAIIRQVSDASNVGTQTHAATSKATPVDADELPLADSAASFGLKKLTLANLKVWTKGVVQTGLAMSGLLKFAAGANIASAATVDLTTATGNTFHLTGTNSVSGWTMTQGQFMNVIVDGVLTLTHNATTNNLPGAANITTAAGDRFMLHYDGTTTYVFAYQRADGTALVTSGGNQKITQTSSVLASGKTAVDFTGIPSWANKVSVLLDAISTNGSSVPLVQLGAGSIDTSGYLGSTTILTSAQATLQSNQGLPLIQSIAAAWVFSSAIELLQLSPGLWVVRGGGAVTSGSTASIVYGGRKPLTGTLDRIRITTVNGSDTFDGGTISLLIEGEII